MSLPATALVLLLAVPSTSSDWPQWRGPALTGASAETGLPLRWTATENVAWSLDLPGHAAATPIVIGDKIFVTVPEGGIVHLWCVERASGKVRWKAPMGPNEGHAHKKHNMGTPSPAADAKRVVTLTGNGVLKAFDHAGKELWVRDLQKEYGPFGLNWGYGSSPLLLEDAVYVQVLHGMRTDEPSYVMRVDPGTGKTRWKVDRKTTAIQESPDSYSTPTPVRVGGRLEIVVTGGDVVTAHDPATGVELWRSHGLNPDPPNNPWYRIVASPLAVDDLVIAPTRVKPMLAIRAGGKGDVTSSHRAWSMDNGPDVPTPASDGKYLYVVGDKGIVTCLEAKTGRVVYGPQRIAMGTYSASPVVADGKVYVTSEDGATTVLKAGPAFQVLGENALGDYTLATPAVAGGQLFIRTSKKLFCIGKK